MSFFNNLSTLFGSEPDPAAKKAPNKPATTNSAAKASDKPAEPSVENKKPVSAHASKKIVVGKPAPKQEPIATAAGAGAPTDQKATSKPRRARRSRVRTRRARRPATISAGADLSQLLQSQTQQLEKEKQLRIKEIELEISKVKLQLENEARDKAREILVDAKAEALKVRTEAEKEVTEQTRVLTQQQKNLDEKLERIDKRLELMDAKEVQLEKAQIKTQEAQAGLDKTRHDLEKKLENVSRMTAEEAQKALFANLEEKLAREQAQLIRQREAEAQESAEEKVKEILTDAMVHGATDYVPEYTISVVKLPSEDAKGKIIGKGGRNIHSIEHNTGVDIDMDSSPTEVRLSCFDPVRREIARISLERLLKDGRIQPSRIEEVVDKVSKEIDKVMLEAGRNLCHDLQVFNLPTDLVRMIGRFKFRFSYGQNLIAHTLEETRIGIKLAHELGLDVETVKLGCLLHDIGKVSEETEGSHVELGVNIAKRFGMPQAVVDCIAQHHEDEPFTGPEQMAVYIADAVSGARPGARYENYDEYVKRLQQLESIATQHPEVKMAYAVQAGREVRVLLVPEKSKDDDVVRLSLTIRDEIKEQATYPGTVTVTVVRETRAQQVAK